MKKRILCLLVLIFTLSIHFLSGCSSSDNPLPQNSNVTIPPTASTEMQTSTSTETEVPSIASLSTPVLTDTSTPESVITSTSSPTATFTFLPTETSTPTASLQPVVLGTGIKSVPNGALIYFIQRDAGGVICGTDRALGFRGSFPKSGDIAKDIKGALKDLFSYSSEWVGGVYNPLYRSKIRVQSVEFDNGLVTVNLSGTYIPPDDPCDNERVRAQVWSTVRQFPEVRATNIYLGRVPFGDLVSNDR